MPGYIAIDTECTGGDFYSDKYPADAPYYVSTCDDDGQIVSWEFDVAPNRLVRIPKSFGKEFARVVADRTPAFHNSLFDLSALAAVPDIKPLVERWVQKQDSFPSVWSAKKPGKVQGAFPAFHDTMLASHVHCNTGSHGLKDLAYMLLDVDRGDEDYLLECIRKARTPARNLGWEIVNPHTADDTNGPALKCDGWLPRMLRQTPGVVDGHHDWDTALSEYGDTDAERTMGLLLFYLEWFRQDESGVLTRCYHEQLQLLPVLLDMRRLGVSLNETSLKRAYKGYKQRQAEQEEVIRRAAKVALGPTEAAELNVNSPAQMKNLIFQGLGLPVVGRTKGGGASLDQKAVPRLLKIVTEKGLSSPAKTRAAADCLTAYGEYKRCGTVMSYFDQYAAFAAKTLGRVALQDSDLPTCVHYRIHGAINPIGTDTTRVSHSRPNLGNVGKGKEEEDEDGNVVGDYKIRAAFGPAPGRIWFAFDYSQLQLNIFAHLAGEHELIEGFRQGQDAHSAVARRLFDLPEDVAPTEIQRRTAKAVNFGYIFGKSEKNLDLIQPGLSKLVRSLFPHATEYLARTKARLNQMIYDKGYAQIEVANGYPLRVPPGPKGERPYAGVCYEVQGAEGVLVKRAMISCRKLLSSLPEHHALYGPDPNWPGLPKACMILQVHDELLFDFWLPDDLDPLNKDRANYAALRELYGEVLTGLAARMVDAGKSLGFDTPVSLSMTAATWDSPMKLDLTKFK